MSTTGERIRELRLRHNMTLDDVARHLGVGRQAIYKYEQNTVTNIPLENIEKMAALFGVTPGYIAGWREEDPPDREQHTPEVQILARGIDKFPKAQREQALNIIKAVFTQYADYFKEDKEDNNAT